MYLFFLEKHSPSFSQVFTRITDQRLMQIKIKSSPEEQLFILAIVFENDCECNRCFFKTKNWNYKHTRMDRRFFWICLYKIMANCLKLSVSWWSKKFFTGVFCQNLKIYHIWSFWAISPYFGQSKNFFLKIVTRSNSGFGIRGSGLDIWLWLPESRTPNPESRNL